MDRYKLRSRWSRMLSRCEDQDHPQYKDYGGRGISVCTDWHDFDIFYNWCLMNKVSAELQLDRSDNDGNYEPDNCEFVTRTVNNRNKRNNKLLTCFEETKTLSEWAEDPRCAVGYSALQMRSNRGWSDLDSITVESGATRKNNRSHNTKTFSAFGEEKILREWIEDSRAKVGRRTLWSRIYAGWEFEKALTTEPRLDAR